MSPNVGNFVHDLVEMAKAMETLPIVERQLETANSMIENYAKQVQALELRAIDRNAEIDELHSRIRSLEVERDDASFRVMEAEDREHNVLAMAKAARVSLDQMTGLLDPPKPEPMKEPEVLTGVPVTESLLIPEAIHSISETGQSESSPTASNPVGVGSHTGDASTQLVEKKDDAALEVDHGPYFGKRYHDHPTYVSLNDWLAGGGTEADYYWRPEHRSIF